MYPLFACLRDSANRDDICLNLSSSLTQWLLLDLKNWIYNFNCVFLIVITIHQWIKYNKNILNGLNNTGRKRIVERIMATRVGLLAPVHLCAYPCTVLSVNYKQVRGLSSYLHLTLLYLLNELANILNKSVGTLTNAHVYIFKSYGFTVMTMWPGIFR